MADAILDLIDKKPPHNLEAEACVLGSIMLDNDVFGVVSEMLQPSHFYDRDHRIIYSAAQLLYDESKSVDVVTIKDRLHASKELSDIGGVDKLAAILESVPSAAHAVDYAKIVRDHAVRRKLIDLSNEVIREAYSADLGAEGLIELVESEIFRMGENAGADEPAEIKRVLLDTVAHIEKLAEQTGQITGCPTGFYELDDKTNGFQPGDLVILAARPSVGKTTFALNCAVNMATRAGKSVAVFSLEMAKEQLAANMLCAEARVLAHHMRRGKLQPDEWTKIVAAAGRLNDVKVFIDDTPALSPTSLRGKARRLKRRFGIDCIIVDYLQLMDAPRSDNRQQEISMISRSLKSLAREIGVPILALSQINRASEREERRPRMSDLRESGAIEQDADVIMFLWRADYQNQDAAEENLSEGRKVELLLAKQRNGPTGQVDLLFFPESMKFENAARNYA